MQAAHHNMQLMLASLQQVLAAHASDAGKASSALEAVLRAAVVALLTHFSEVLELLQNPLHEFLLVQSFLARVLCPESKGVVAEAAKHIEEVRSPECHADWVFDQNLASPRRCSAQFHQLHDAHSH